MFIFLWPFFCPVSIRQAGQRNRGSESARQGLFTAAFCSDDAQPMSAGAVTNTFLKTEGTKLLYAY
jgi:hypothetical protein